MRTLLLAAGRAPAEVSIPPIGDRVGVPLKVVGGDAETIGMCTLVGLSSLLDDLRDCAALQL